MMEILQHPDPMLRRKCDPVEDYTDELRDQVRQMKELVWAINAGEHPEEKRTSYGLSAPQVGIPLRFFIAGKDLRFMANPEIIRSRGEERKLEACLSLPEGLHVRVPRPYKVKLRYETENGVPRISRFRGMSARVVCHEMDHLDGKLIIDYREEEA